MKQKAIFNLYECIPDDFGDELNMADAGDGEECTILNCCVDNGSFDENYYNIRFENGDIMHGVSAYHLDC